MDSQIALISIGLILLPGCLLRYGLSSVFVSAFYLYIPRVKKRLLILYNVEFIILPWKAVRLNSERH